MKNSIVYNNLGTINFASAWDIQKNLFDQVLSLKRQNINNTLCEQIESYNYLLFCEHTPVYTLGKSGSENNLLVNNEILKNKNIEFFRIDRGGDITFHGPGQIVGYPILDLEKFNLGVKEYIAKLEEVIIKSLKVFDIKGERAENAIGVWLEPSHPQKARKICAIGVKASRYVTMHGFAFNVNTDLSYFNMINPCGFKEKGVTSIKEETGKETDFKEVQNIVLKNFKEVFDVSFIDLDT